MRAFEDGLLSLLRGKNVDILNGIRDSRDLSDDLAAKLKSVVEGYAKTSLNDLSVMAGLGCPGPGKREACGRV